jgi:hypothetical protein
MVAVNKEATEPRVPLGKVEVITKIVRSPPWLGWPLWNICVTNDQGYVPLVVNTSRPFPHSWLITGFVTRLTRRVSHVEQELTTLPGTPEFTPVFSRIRVTRPLVLCVCFEDRCLSFVPFLLAIVLSVNLKTSNKSSWCQILTHRLEGMIPSKINSSTVYPVIVRKCFYKQYHCLSLLLT